ncbi:MAG: prepilin-type N-terminal cleavage/methylation domain-containing protein [Verrucomicrobiales bacterium]|nr:prepilin-type N-terminal cleavage/methylation domain-containing protein [Verrucomicrobiales bacterium]
MKKGFTLIELLVVITIIGILAALTIGAGSVLREKAARSRAAAEIAAFDVALERYKIDNGDYPSIHEITVSGSTYSMDNRSQYVGVAPQVTAASSDTRGTVTGGDGGKLLFACLIGRDKFKNATNVAYPQYMEIKLSQIGDQDNSPYFVDPFGNAYGYYYDATGTGTGNTSKSLYNIVEPDIWSTGPTKSQLPTDVTLNWIKNWASQ